MPETLLPGSVLALSDQAADRLLRLDSGDAALLYLHRLRRGALQGLPWSPDRLQAAQKDLVSIGLAEQEPPPPPAPPIEEAPPE